VKENVEYWISYLSTHLSDSKLSIVIAGNRIDEVKDGEQKKKIQTYFTSLKGDLISDFVLLSALQVTNVEDLVRILQEKCQSLLLEKDKFMIPKLYKMTAESLQKSNSFLIGIIISS
jgi:GTPase SAR1 family protein